MSQVQGTTDRYNSSGELPHKQNKEEHTDAITAANLPQRLMVLKWWCGGQAAVPRLLPECLPPSLLPVYSRRAHHHPLRTFTFRHTLCTIRETRRIYQLPYIRKGFFSLIATRVEV